MSCRKEDIGMKQHAFCEYCMKEQPYTVNELNKTSSLNEEEISYEGKEACCNECGNEIFVNDVCRENLQSLYCEYRRKHNLIDTDKIQRILKKYNISEESLSLVLGFSKETVSRYIKGDMISSHDSAILKKIYDNSHYYSIMLETNKERIKPYEYCRSRKAVRFMNTSGNVEKKIDGVIKYILSRCDDVTPLMIQKLLYYVQSFYYVFTEHFLFEEDLQAGDRGPEFESVMERYRIYGFDSVNNEIMSNENLNLEDIEKNVAEAVLKFYGCYSGKILDKMVQNESPWILTRKQMLQSSRMEIELSPEESRIINKELILAYFMGVKDKYSMISVLDMEKYSRDVFEKISF